LRRHCLQLTASLFGCPLPAASASGRRALLPVYRLPACLLRALSAHTHAAARSCPPVADFPGPDETRVMEQDQRCTSSHEPWNRPLCFTRRRNAICRLTTGRQSFMIQHKPTTYLHTFRGMADTPMAPARTHVAIIIKANYYGAASLAQLPPHNCLTVVTLIQIRGALCSLSGRADGYEPPTAKTSAVYNQTNNRK
jgi:hypothetical protein